MPVRRALCAIIAQPAGAGTSTEEGTESAHCCPGRRSLCSALKRLPKKVDRVPHRRSYAVLMRDFSAKVVANAENEETSKNEKHSQLPSGVTNLMAGFDPCSSPKF